MTRDPLSAFDNESVETVATETGIDADRLRSITREHQHGVRDLPGVDDIVYEWRNQFHLDPLVHRTESVYVLALRAHVWEEFGERLDLSESELDALRRLHDRVARGTTDDTGRFDSDEALVLSRP